MPPRVGVVLPVGGASTTEEALVLGLRERGYLVGKDILIDWRRYSETGAQIEAITAELIRSGPDVLVAVGTPPARAAVARTSTIPVIFVAGDPTATGLAASLSRPGSNATGISILSELAAKRLETLHELAPSARRIAYLMNPSNIDVALQLPVLQKAARGMGLALEPLEGRDASSLEAALATLRRGGSDAILVSGDGTLVAHAGRIARAVAESGRPAVFPWREYHDEGVLMTYGPSRRDVMRRVAGYVDRILKGAVPAELPVEQITKFDLVINLRVAKQMGIAVPDALLVRADEVLR